jgi:hypothetical protein
MDTDKKWAGKAGGTGFSPLQRVFTQKHSKRHQRRILGPSVFIHVHLWLKIIKTKNPLPCGSGFDKSCEYSKPGCRAGQQQRVRKQQVQVAIHV